MKTLIITDIHEDYEAAQNAWNTEKPDLILDCGDHSDVKNLFELTPHYFIHGNHEPNSIELDVNEFPIPNKILSGVIYTFKNNFTSLNVTGIGGNYSHSQKEYSVNQNDIERLKKINCGSLDVILLHESPLNLTPNREEHKLANEILQEIIRIQPSFIFSGHTHIYQENIIKTKGKELRLINLPDMAYGYGVLEKEKDQFSFRRVICRYR